MKIMLSGGGTLGPVTPLLAIYEKYRQHNKECGFVWVGSKKGVEREVVESYSIPYYTISSGKFRRYLSFLNIIDVFKIIFGFFQSLILLWQEKPTLLITAGGFVSVPLHFAAFTMGIPTWVHQQDVGVGLANKIMGMTASKITTALQNSIKDFNKKKTEWIGNPVRDLSVSDTQKSYELFGIPNNAKVVLAFGGGTGSNKLNNLLIEALPHIDRNWHIIHLTGKNRDDEQAKGAQDKFSNYHPYRFFTTEMRDAYAIANVVVGRGGFVTISELAALSKPAVLLPMSNTHQEQNVKLLSDNKAAVIFDEKKVNGLDLAHIISELIQNVELSTYLGKKLHKILPPLQNEKLIEIIDQLQNDN